jgi:O-antigen ligase
MTWQGAAGDGYVILASIPLLAFVVFLHIVRLPLHWGAIVLVVATLSLPLLQIVPWPGVPPWASVHGEWQVDQARVFGVAPTSTLSIAPDASLRAFFALLPPASVFLGVLLLQPAAQRRVIVVIGALALVSAAIGLLQAAFGESTAASPLGPADGQARGFFSNRNHFAALMYIGIALSGGGLALSLRRMLADFQPTRHGPRVIVWATAFLLLVVACMVARSRAGVVLGAGVILALFAIIVLDAARASRGSRRAFALVAILSGLAAIQVGLWGVLERFNADPFEDGRIVVQTTTWQAAEDSLPWGTGMGTFRRVYEQREPLESVMNAWVNRAHNDWLEFRLEAGWPGTLLLCAWIGWWIVALRRRGAGSRAESDPRMALLQRLAVVAIIAVALHSLVDFPMRTTAIFTIVAALVAVSVSRDPGLTTDPRGRREQEHGNADHQGALQAVMPVR